MILAAIGDTGYNILLFLHILTAFVAFAPAFVHPVLNAQVKSLGPQGHSAVLAYIAKNGQRIYATALILSGLLGFGVVGLSDDVYELSQGWLIAAIIIWIVMNGILHAILIPGERAMGQGDLSAEPRVSVAGAVITVLLLVQLYLMVWQPGL